MNLTFKADLHCHSSCSDGSFPPEQILSLAKEINLKGLSITDHDTLEAYTDPLFQKAKELELFLLPGVEISSTLISKTIHILAYGKNLLTESFQKFLEDIQLQREERNRGILENLKKQGFSIEEEELKAFAEKHVILKGKIIGRPHMAALMIEKGYVKTFQEAFDLYLGDTGICFVRGMKHHPVQVIEQIHAAKGFAVIAHPHLIKSSSHVRELLTFPFDGIECYYGLLDPAFEKKWEAIADKRKWIKTGGSDFHGKMKPHIPLGCSWAGYEAFFQMYGHPD